MLFVAAAPLWQVAGLAFGLAAAAVALPRLLPRSAISMALALLVAAGATALTSIPAFPTWASAVGSGVALVAAALLAWHRPAVALRLAGAAVGARLMVQGLEHRLAWGAAAAAALLAVDAWLRAGPWPEGPPPISSARRAVRASLAAGGLGAAAILTLPWLATDLRRSGATTTPCSRLSGLPRELELFRSPLPVGVEGGGLPVEPEERLDPLVTSTAAGVGLLHA